MAKPISYIRKPEMSEEEIKAKTLSEITDNLAENDESLKKTLAILSELNDSGILETIESLLKAKDKVAEIALGQVTRKEVTNIINNTMGAAGVLSELDPEQTKKLLTGITTGLNEAKEKQHEKISVFSLLKAIGDPDVNRAIGFGLNFLKGLGKGLK